MNELLKKSLAEIVRADHRTAAVFERNGLDFCCKGKRPLAEACQEKGINPEILIPQLEEAQSTPLQITDFNSLPVGELIDHIVNTHHNYVRQELPELMKYLQKVCAKHGDRHPELFSVFDLTATLREDMELHMEKEERILFPRIRSISGADGSGIPVTLIQAPITMMEQEHDQASEIMTRIREITNNYNPPADACTTYRISYAGLRAFEADLHQHVHLENNILFPRAIDSLN